MFLKKNERIEFGLLLKIYVTKHRICIWIFKNKNKTNQPVNKKPLVQCSTWNNRLVPHQERNVSMLYVVTLLQFSSVHFSHSVMSNSLQPQGLQHTRPPCPSPTPGVYPNSCPLSWWCHPTVSSSIVSFSSCPQSFPASRSFQMSQLFASGGQSIRVSSSTSVLPMNTQDWSPLGWTGWISLQSKGLARVFSSTTV